MHVAAGARGGVAAGFTLLEVLVAIVVLSFGVLGMVGLQAASLNAHREARLQSAGVRLASELAELMRGNKQVATQLDATANPYLQADFRGPAPARDVDCVQGCTAPLDAARYDMQQWLTQVVAQLPGARVVVCFDASPYDADGLPRRGCTSNGNTGVVQVKLGWTRGKTRRSAAASDAFEQVSDAKSRPYLVLPITPGNRQ